jgi:predicted 3-demethylubiquinone-9 3-methyltransferase (glyoxalase superfamily)
MGLTVVPFLMFEGAAGEAIELYAAAFDDAEVVDAAFAALSTAARC